MLNADPIFSAHTCPRSNLAGKPARIPKVPAATLTADATRIKAVDDKGSGGAARTFSNDDAGPNAT